MPAHDPSTDTTARSRRLGRPADEQADRFEAHRGHLQAVAYRMLGSLAEAEDAVQEAWLRLSRADVRAVDNLGGWLTTVVGRICLDVLRSRRSRREREVAVGAPLARPPAGPAGRSAPSGAAGVAGVAGPPGGSELPADRHTAHDPEHEAELADEVGLALLVVLGRLTPVERVAFVLHDLFAVPFAEIAPIVERSEATTKRLASRARQRVRGGVTAPGGPSLADQRRLVEAFLAATRRGDIEALLTVLAPDVVRRADLAAVAPGKPAELRGARAVAEETAGNAARARYARAVLVDGTAGVIVAPAGHLVLALRLTLDPTGTTIGHIDTIAHPTRLASLHITLLGAG